MKTKTGHTLIPTFFLLLLSLFLMAGAPRPALAQSGPTGAAYRGQRIFTEHCTQCHGEQGQGDGPIAKQAPVPPPDFTDPTFVENRSPQEIYDFIANGSVENLMPSWKDSLSESEIWDAAAYVWSLHLSEADLTQAAILYQTDCAQCHGKNGEGHATDPVGPSLNGAPMLSQSDSALREAILADTHPTLDNIVADDITLAMAGARAFSLGFSENTPSLSGNGAITVSISNGTTGEIMPALPVRLVIFESESFSDIQEGVSDDNGQLAWNDLPTDSTWAYIVEVIYNNVPYDSNLIQFDPGSTSVEVPIQVYESGASLADIRISRAHWVVSFVTPNQVDIGELYALTNTGNRVYIGEGGPDVMPPQVLRFVFPENATNLGVEGGDTSNRYLIQGNEIIDTLPFAPGNRQILFRYTLPVTEGEVTLAHPLTYPIDYLNLLVPEVGVKVDALAWTAEDTIQTQTGNYLNYVITEQSAGASPAAVISGIKPDMVDTGVTSEQGGHQVMDANATPGISGYPFLPWLIALLSAILLLAGTLFIVRRQQALAEALPQIQTRMQEDLLEQIADLDDDFEEGRLSRSDYEEQRQLLKSQLAALLLEESS